MRKVEGWSELRSLWLSAGVWTNDKGEAEIVDWARGPFMRYIKPDQWLDFINVTVNAVGMVQRGEVERKYLGTLSTWISKCRWMEARWDVTEEHLPRLSPALSLKLSAPARSEADLLYAAAPVIHCRGCRTGHKTKEFVTECEFNACQP